MSARKEIPTVIVSLGTDHHKFDRLVDWVDEWIEQRESPVNCLVQHGSSKLPRLAKAVERLPRTDLLKLYAESTVVLVQGGPGSILDVREVGKIPIAVPRRPELIEVVDSHQIAFTRTMERQGDAFLADSFEVLVTSLESVILNPNSIVTLPRVANPDLASQRLERAIQEFEQNSYLRQIIRRFGHLLLKKKV